MSDDPRRALPSVDAVVAEIGARPEPHALIVDAARAVLADARRAPGGGNVTSPRELAAAAVARLEDLRTPSLRRVINASGVILQTNLGRAPLSEASLRAMAHVSAASNLEFDLQSGARGSRHEHVRSLVARATGAEDGIAVNNNAAALFFALQALAQGPSVSILGKTI